MKIALYGMPCSGKSTLLDKITDIKVISGSKELSRICGGSFSKLSEDEKHQVRIKFTEYITSLVDEVVVSDGHYSFMENIVFTEADGDLYDIFIYLYCSPDKIRKLDPDIEVIIATNVIQNKAVEALKDYLVIVTRVSKNSFIGVNQPKQNGMTGPDTADRLFNLIEKRYQ